MIPQLINYLSKHIWFNILVYLVLVAFIIVLASLLSNFCVLLKQKLHLSDGVIAGIIMSIITSLPELITCIAAVISNKKGSIGVGDIIGSNIFDITILSFFLLLFVYFFWKQKVNNVNITTLVFCFVDCIIVFLGMLSDHYLPWLSWNGFNFWSLILFGSYILWFYFVFKNQKIEKQDILQDFVKHENKYFKKFNAFWLVLIIIGLSLVLSIVSVLICDASVCLIFNHWKINETFGGALLLGVSTSLPEVICCIDLAYKKEYNMLISTMIGSCCFNFFILTFGNIAYMFIWNGENSMYEFNKYSIIQILALACIIALAYIYCRFNALKKHCKRNNVIGINAFLLLIIIFVFISYLFLNLVYSSELFLFENNTFWTKLFGFLL